MLFSGGGVAGHASRAAVQHGLDDGLGPASYRVGYSGSVAVHPLPETPELPGVHSPWSAPSRESR